MGTSSNTKKVIFGGARNVPIRDTVYICPTTPNRNLVYPANKKPLLLQVNTMATHIYA